MSDWGNQTVTSSRNKKWELSWIGMKNKIRTNKVRITTRNKFFYPFVLSIHGMLGNYALVVLTYLS